MKSHVWVIETKVNGKWGVAAGGEFWFLRKEARAVKKRYYRGFESRIRKYQAVSK